MGRAAHPGVFRTTAKRSAVEEVPGLVFFSATVLIITARYALASSTHSDSAAVIWHRLLPGRARQHHKRLGEPARMAFLGDGGKPMNQTAGEAPNQISEITRRTIIDTFSVANISWAGRLQDDEFLSRLYDLSKLPSFDHRYKDAAGDIYQHTVRNADDWDSGWVFYDRPVQSPACLGRGFLALPV
ncbi:hypothetical protein [Bosea vaviloviae]|uniref:AbiJ-related protein n=1 Tax=Bosea vaviloviae TaxID=1526658 RepID=UPI001314AB8F|nr:hypothetical protein [Bosea vaviloviae]